MYIQGYDMGGMDNARLKKVVLERLLELSFRVGDFTLASGRKSDYYVDARLTTLDPFASPAIAKLFLAEAKALGATAVGGLTLGADPIIGAMVALGESISYPIKGFIVRKAAKGHGTGKLIEGNLDKIDKVVVVEDVVTTGGSAILAIDAVKEMGADVVGVLAVVDREEGGREAIEKLGLPLKALFTADELKREAK